MTKLFFTLNGKKFRRRQDSNLRGITPLDFKSNALTTRPRLLPYYFHMFSYIYLYEFPNSMKFATSLK